MKKEIKLQWNVYHFDFSNKDLHIYNVFEHRSFNNDVQELLKKKDITREDFAEKLRREAQYRFWAKCEWECVITGSEPHIDRREFERLMSEYEECGKDVKRLWLRTSIRLADKNKIDVYEQLMLNWEQFEAYVWSHSKACGNT